MKTLFLLLVFLSPMAHSSSSEEILGRCHELLKRRGNEASSILQNFDQECDTETRVQIRSLSDFSSIASALNRQESLTHINLAAFRTSLKALIMEQIRFGNEKLPLDSKPAFINAMLAKFPKLRNFPHYQRAVLEVYTDLDVAAKRNSPSFVKTDPVTTKNKFNAHISSIEGVCLQIRNRWKETFGESSTGWQATMSSVINNDSRFRDFWRSSGVQLNQALQKIVTETDAGHYLGTEHFKHQIYQPAINHLEKCALQDHHKVFSRKITNNDLVMGNWQTKKMLNESLEKVSDNQMTAQSGDVEDIKESMSEYLQEDPYSVRMALLNLPTDQRKALSAQICQDTQLILRNSRNKKIMKGGAALVASAALVVSGIGAPAGAVLAAEILGTTVSVAALADEVSEFNGVLRVDELNDLALAQRRRSIDEYVSKHNELHAERIAKMGTMGLAALGAAATVTRSATLQEIDDVVSPLNQIQDASDVIEGARELAPGRRR